MTIINFLSACRDKKLIFYSTYYVNFRNKIILLMVKLMQLHVNRTIKYNLPTNVQSLYIGECAHLYLSYILL